MRRIAAFVAVLAVVLLLVVTQLVLPGLAEQRLRDRLAHSGRVERVEVSAFPALELLWGDADKVVVRLTSYRSGTSHLASLLDQAAGVGTIDASAGTLQAGLLTVRDARLSKRGDQLTGTARVTEADLRAAIPILQSLTPVASGNGTLTLRGTATLFGVTASIDATVGALDGKLVVQPDVPFGGFATITVFADPHVQVQGVSAGPASGGFSVTATARLH